jgi:hypothetical protein
MVFCTEEMFKSVETDENENLKITKRLCPDMSLIKDHLKVKNTYSDKKDRESFSI